MHYIMYMWQSQIETKYNTFPPNPTIQELAVDKSRLDEVNTLALKLVGENHTGSHVIQEHQATLNMK